jgi:N-carbamoyl-L-amino-acid hydrolase
MLTVNGERLWRSIMDMAKIGGTPKGGVNRLTVTDDDKASRDVFCAWCREAGLTVTVDEMGNIFGRRPGRNDSLAPVMTGSHLDSQPTGGKFDGAYGVMAALECIRALNDAGVTTEHPIEIVSWTNEEGARFPPPMLASGVFAGVFAKDWAYGLADDAGLTFGGELERIGYRGGIACEPRPIEAYFELHIEQGPVLENEGLTIGIVTGAAGQRWFEIDLTGVESHAGTTPMELRKDALLAASMMIASVNRIAKAAGGRATVGRIQAGPGSRNIIPGTAWLTIDSRHETDAGLDEMETGFRSAVTDIAAETGVEIAMRPFWSAPASAFNPECIEMVARSAARLGYSRRRIVSGAAHDAVYLSRITPTAMIFIPCEKGLSHNEAENITPADAEAGANVLLGAVLERAQV